MIAGWFDWPRRRGERRGVVGAVLIVSVSLATSCGAHERKDPRSVDSGSSFINRQGDIRIAVVQCLVDEGLIPRSDLNKQKWLSNGRIVPGMNFDMWFSVHPTTRYGGNKLEDWVADADRVWPTRDCKALIPGAK